MTLEKSVDELFRAALEVGDEDRNGFLQARCAGDPVLERQVRALLEASTVSDDVLQNRFDTARKALWRSVLNDETPHRGEDLSGRCIDSWQLVRRLARGGLATVYLAQRADGNYEQRAAFKVLRRGLDTDDLIARFRAERQMLSTLAHPSIARILDGGALADGRPYLVLEYVDGLPITTWCENNQADIDGRIRLLMAVLDALQHAHSHLIVHRDIKPSNILVSRDGSVSLLDFGIAKLLDPEALPGASTLTRTGVSLLTPGYGSPEQHAGKTVTTASDVYQVGQVMYELLTGRRPFDGVGRPADAELILPSRRLRGRPRYQKVRGDLDAITARAMHLDPARRYASAADMREDLQRYLDSRPILARPDTLRYRLGKLVRRRPWLVPVTAIAVLAVAGYIATLTVYTRQLQVEQQRASAAQSFLVDLLRSPDPYAPADPERGTGITVTEALDLGVERLLTAEYDDDPELRVSLLASIASVYRSLDQHRKAIELREEVLARQRLLHGEMSKPVLASLAMLASQYKTIGDYPPATRYYDEQLAVARALYGDDDPELGVAEALSADFETSNGNFDVAERLLRQGIPRMRVASRAYAHPLINALVDLSGIVDEESPAEAMALLAEAQTLAESVYGAHSLLAALVYSQTAVAYSLSGEFDRATGVFSRAAAIYASLVGPDHGETLAARNRLGTVYSRMEAYDRAEVIHRDVLERYLAKYGSRHRGVALSYQNLATAIARQGRYAEAIPLHQKALDSYRAVLGEDHKTLAVPLVSIATGQLQSGNFDAAAVSASEALGLLERTGSEHRLAGVARCLLDLTVRQRREPEVDIKAATRLCSSSAS